MNQAKVEGKWVEVEYWTDGIYANGIKVANVYNEIENEKCTKLETVDI